ASYGSSRSDRGRDGLRPQPAGAADDPGGAPPLRHAAEPRPAPAEAGGAARRTPPPGL
ncbi:MAG: hypothetical protein AVDCRST_MAG16-907, partial [uncultured Frankineae bacterium]